MADFVARALTRFRWLLLGLAAVLAVVCYPLSRELAFDRSVENMFAPNDPLLPPYAQLKRTFGGNELVLAVYRDEALLAEDRRGLDRLIAIRDELAATPGVRGTLSLAELDQSLQKMAPAANLFGLGTVPTQGIVDRQSDLSARFLKLFEGYTHGADGQTAAVVCILEPHQPDGAPRDQTIGQLHEKIQRLADGQIAGEPVMLVEGFRYIEEDARRLGWTCTLLLSITILLCFRSVRWMLIVLCVVQLSLLLTRGVLVVSGIRLSMVSSMLTAIVTIVGIATVVHVIVRFRAARRQGLSPHDSFVRTASLLAAPVFWAIATDSVGFASLMVAEVGPVRDFGLMMSVGAMMVLVSVILLVPGLALLGWHPVPRHAQWEERMLDNRLSVTLGWVERHPLVVSLLVLATVAITAAGASRLEVETDFTRNFRADSEIVQAYNTVETDLGGAGVWDVVLPAPQNLDWGYLLRVFRLEQRLRQEVTTPDSQGQPQPALKVLSMGDAVVAGAPSLVRTRSPLRRSITLRAAVASVTAHMPIVAESLHAQDPRSVPAPAGAASGQPQSSTADGERKQAAAGEPHGDSQTVNQPDSESDTRAEPNDDSAASDDQNGDSAEADYYYRIMLRAVERQPAAQKLQLIDQVTAISREEFPEAEVTGFFVLLTNLISSIIRDQWLTFGVALGGIGLTMLLAFVRPQYALIALVPNAFPILVVTGLMGWLGLTINMGAAMIAAVSMGLSIDSSIHYITSFRRARQAGKTVSESLAEVQHSVGLAMVFSTLALIIGFSVLSSSDFVPTIYFGTLVSLTMLGGLLGNLIILPLLLRLITREAKPAA